MTIDLQAREQTMIEALWTKVRGLRAEAARLAEELALERDRRRLAEKTLAEREKRKDQPAAVMSAREAYAGVRELMWRLQQEPAQGTPEWRKWVKRGIEDDWKSVYNYVEEMARERVT